MLTKDEKKRDFDNLVLNIEFLLISVVQGFALSALASAAVSIIANSQYEYFPYLLSAFLIILVFWSQSIVHALSFIDWPIDLPHTFLYFLAGFVEVIAFSQMITPLRWFISILFLYLVGAVLYWYDLRLIRNHKPTFTQTKAKRNLYQHILKQQVFDLKVATPMGLIIHVLAVGAIWFYPQLFIDRDWHLALATIQAVIAILALYESLHSFKKRIRLISDTI